MYVEGIIEWSPAGWVVTTSYHVGEEEYWQALLAASPAGFWVWKKAPRRISQGKWGAMIDYNSGTQRAIDHIKDGHFFNSRPGLRSSRFSASNSTTAGVKNLVDDAIVKGKHSTNSRGDYSVLHTSDDVIGTDFNGRKTKTIQVFVDVFGDVLNAYPVPRP